MEFISRRIIKDIEGSHDKCLNEYAMYGSDKYNEMVERIRLQLQMTTLKFNTVDNLVKAIGIEKCNICTHCFDGSEFKS